MKRCGGAPKKLTEQDVREIREALRNPYHGIGRVLGRRYGVGDCTISMIRHGFAWKTLDHKQEPG